MAQPREVARAVDLRGLDDVHWYRQQAREHDDGDQRRPLPHIDQDQGGKSRLWIAQHVPVVQVQPAQHVGVQTQHRVYQEVPQQPDDGGRDEHRHQQDRHQHLAPARQFAERQRDQRAEDHLEADRADEILERRQPGTAHVAVGEQARPILVLVPLEVQPAHQAHVVQAHPQQVEERVERDAR